MHIALRLIVLLVILLGPGTVTAQNGQEAGWPTYGGDAGGQHFSSATQINRANISHFHPVWTYHTHALDSGRPGTLSAAFEATPVLFKETLYFATAFDKVVALDHERGPSDGRSTLQFRSLT